MARTLCRAGSAIIEERRALGPRHSRGFYQHEVVPCSCTLQARCTQAPRNRFARAMGMAVPPENDENTDGDGLGSFAVDLAAQQAAARAAAGEADTEEEQERAAAFMQRALAESARMTAACNKDQRKIERNRAAMGGALEPAIAEHAAEVLSPEHAALVAAARAAQEE